MPRRLLKLLLNKGEKRPLLQRKTFVVLTALLLSAFGVNLYLSQLIVRQTEDHFIYLQVGSTLFVIAVFFAIVVYESKLLETSIRMKNRTSVVNKINKVLDSASEESLDQSLTKLLSVIIRFFDFDAAILWRLDSEILSVEAAAAKRSEVFDGFSEFAKKIIVRENLDPINRAWSSLSSKQPFDQLAKDFPERVQLTRTFNLKHSFCFPITFGSKTLAVIEIFNQKALTRSRDQREDCVLLGARIGEILRRLETEAALKENIKLLEEQQIALNEAAIVASTDVSGKITYVNDKFVEISGYSREELLGQSHRIIKSDFHPKEFYINLWKTLKSGQVWHGEIKNRRKDGTFYWVDATIIPFRDQHGRITQYTAIRHDITAQKLAEEKIRQQQEDLHHFFESSQDFLCVAGPDGYFKKVNSTFERKLGYTTYELKSHPFLEFVHPDDLLGTLRDLAHLSEKLPTTSFINRFRKKDGSYLWLSWHSAQIPDGRLYSIARDVTQQLEMEKALINAKKSAENASRVKSDFLANMSHEIRTPLNAIIGTGDLLYESPLNEDQKRYVEIFKKAGENLLSIINDILDISKIESGHLEIEQSEVYLRSVIEEIAEISALKAFDKNLEFVCMIEPNFPDYFVGDSLRIKQVLMNLIGNAIKFTHQGSIRITASKNPHSDRPGNILITIQDTGLGISQEKQAGLFRAFAQADSSVTKKFGGTGLGLVISKELTELMGGSIWIESEEGQGSKFSFTLQCQPSRRQGPYSELLRSIDLRGTRILIISDNEYSNLQLKEQLEYYGAATDVVTSVDSAVSRLASEFKLNTQSYELIICDLQATGDPSGRSIISKFKSLALSELPKIILASSTRKDLTQAELKNLGFHSLIYKPIKRDPLILHIIDALGILDTNTIQASFDNSDFTKAVVSEDEHQKENPLSILVVDDSEDNRTLIKHYLKTYKHLIMEADNGAIALERYKSGKFDLILMDMQMPVKDGYQATKEIRAWEKIHHIAPTPIVALTAYALKEDQEKSLMAGCNLHVPKPIKKQVLLNVLKFAVGTGSQRKVA